MYEQQKKSTLLIKGIFDSSGTTLLKIEKPVLYKRELSQSTPYQQTGKYSLVVEYPAGDSTCTYFDALVAGDSPNAGSQHGFFELQIPASENIDRIILSGTHSKKIYALFSRKEIIVRQ